MHEQISFIPQDTELFHRSLAENIRHGNPAATDHEIQQAAARASASDFIEAHPQGFHAVVGERGIKLSGGERQRIALARGLLKNAPIMILDEATSSLDSVTEQAIQRTLDQPDMAARTVIVVAHRLSTIAHLDRILVFDKGRIVEDGTHEELLSLKATYWQLWSRQANGFSPVKYARPQSGCPGVLP